MTITPANRIDHSAYLTKAISYKDYRRNVTAELASGADTKTAAYLPLNDSRMRRIEKTFVPSSDAIGKLAAMKEPLQWLVISEHWCGDAAQILPVMNALAEASHGRIRLSIVYRDANPELMDVNLTGTSRAIPKLIQLNAQDEPMASWGPRPDEAQTMVMTLRRDPATASSYTEPLHAWYAKDKQRSTERELIALLPSN